MNSKLTMARLVLAIISTVLEEAAIWAVWRWILPDLGVKLSYQVLIIIMVVWAAFGVWLFMLTTWTLKKQAQAGLPSMVGTKGKVAAVLAPEGLVKIRGELWKATSSGEKIDTGEEVMVEGQDGLKLSVRRVNPIEPKR